MACKTNATQIEITAMKTIAEGNKQCKKYCHSGVEKGQLQYLCTCPLIVLTVCKLVRESYFVPMMNKILLVLK